MQAYDQQTLRTTTELAAIATVAYSGPDGMLRMISVTPLLLDGAPAFTLAYARSDLAQEIRAGVCQGEGGSPIEQQQCYRDHAQHTVRTAVSERGDGGQIRCGSQGLLVVCLHVAVMILSQVPSV